MQAVYSSLIAVLGTLIGSGMTFFFQGRTLVRNENFARNERIRQERMTVYSAFAGAVLELRTRQADQWAARLESSSNPSAYAEAKTAQASSRVAAYQALYRVRLVTDDETILTLANQAMDLVLYMHMVETFDELVTRSGDVRGTVERFIDATTTGGHLPA
ncbi:hypothetical protein [Nonomuraea sp. JJY05]|uniref:hypothetical protein n=1 Tax=Nonomuraea sp. JJY05 TaxID=3350255 RepID=UPI00373F9F22